MATAGEPPQFAIGIKELWDIPKDRLKPGTVIHTLGYPLREEEFGGSWLYAMGDGRISIGFVVGLEYRDPLFDPHAAFQHFKRHPFISSILEGGQIVRYGAKALPEGGWKTQPQLFVDGALIVGDAANFVNSMRLKGIHLAMRSGMLAAETAFDAIRAGDTSSAKLSAYKARVDASAIKTELYPVRNVHQAFGAGLDGGQRGRRPRDVHERRCCCRMCTAMPGHKQMRTIEEYYGLAKRDILVPSNAAPIDRKLTFDKVTGAHYSGTHHDENQPVHLLVNTDVCHTICGSEYGHPCVRFCPANVYEMVDNGAGGKRLQINASNCVHCKTCDIMDPYGVITWVAPEGGEGPSYDGMYARVPYGALQVRKVPMTDTHDWRQSRRKRAEVAAIATLGYPVIRALTSTWKWKVSGAEHVDAITAAGHQPILALWHGRILAATPYFQRRGIVAMASENFDGEWIARLLGSLATARLADRRHAAARPRCDNW